MVDLHWVECCSCSLVLFQGPNCTLSIFILDVIYPDCFVVPLRAAAGKSKTELHSASVKQRKLLSQRRGDDKKPKKPRNEHGNKIKLGRSLGLLLLPHKKRKQKHIHQYFMNVLMYTEPLLHMV